MSLYDPPHYNSSGTYNEFDYSNNIVDATTIDTTIFVHKSGDSMVGGLNLPSLNLYDLNGSLEFSDLTEQKTAFSQVYIDKINSSANTAHLSTTDITFLDTTVQNTALTTALITKINNSNTALTNTSYASSTNTTSISNNVFCASLTCGNINTSYLSTLTSNVQTQLNNVNIPTNMMTIDTAQTITGTKTFNTDVNTLGYIKQNGNHLLPIGTILMYSGSSIPLLFVKCGGQSYNRSEFPELFAVIGTTYGSISSTTFQIPDMGGLFVRGAGTNAITGSTLPLGQVQNSSIENHSHGFDSIDNTGLTSNNALTGIDLINVLNGSLNKIFAKFTNPITNFITKTTSTMLNSSGISFAANSETRPINIALNYMIKIR